MGRDKALLTFQDGTTWLEGHYQQLRALGLDPWVVLGPTLAFLEGEFAKTIVNPEPETGPIGSLKLALAKVNPGCQWLWMSLIDHPGVAQETLSLLLDSCRDHPEASMWAPCYKGRHGHPVIFSQKMFSDLRQSPFDEGARYAVKKHRDQRFSVVVQDSMVLSDIDTQEELESFRLRSKG